MGIEPEAVVVVVVQAQMMAVIVHQDLSLLDQMMVVIVHQDLYLLDQMVMTDPYHHGSKMVMTDPYHHGSKMVMKGQLLHGEEMVLTKIAAFVEIVHESLSEYGFLTETSTITSEQV